MFKKRFAYFEEAAETGSTGASAAAPAAAAAPAPAALAAANLFGDGSKDGAAAAPVAKDPAAAVTGDAKPAEAATTGADGTDPPALKMPGKEAPPEEWDAFYKQIGKPAAPEDYELTVDDGGTGEFAKAIAPLLHKANVTADQAKVLNEGWNEMQKTARETFATQEADRIKAMDSKNKAEAESLAKEWGTANTENMEHAKRAIGTFVPGTQDEQYALISSMENVLGYAKTIRFFQSLGKSIGEAGAEGLGTNNHDGAKKTTAEVLYGPGAK